MDGQGAPWQTQTQEGSLQRVEASNQRSGQESQSSDGIKFGLGRQAQQEKLL